MASSDANIANLVLCLWATWACALLFIPSGWYFMKTGRSVLAWRRRSLGEPVRRWPFDVPARKLPRSAFEKVAQQGPAVRRHGLYLLIFGALNALAFVALSLYFWTRVTDSSAQGSVILFMIVVTPILVYFGTTGA